MEQDVAPAKRCKPHAFHPGPSLSPRYWQEKQRLHTKIQFASQRHPLQPQRRVRHFAFVGPVLKLRDELRIVRQPKVRTE